MLLCIVGLGWWWCSRVIVHSEFGVEVVYPCCCAYSGFGVVVVVVYLCCCA